MSNSVNEYVEKYYNNFQENAKGEIEGSIKDFITDSIQDYLVDRGYGRSNAEAIVDFITSNNQNIDYSHMLDIKEDSPLYAKLADMEIFDSIEKLRDFTNTLNKAVGTYDLCLKMDEDIQKNGKCDAEDLKSLLSTILDSTESMALRKKLCKNNQLQKNDFVVIAADRSLSFLFQYKLNTAICQAPDAKYPDATERSAVKSGYFAAASVQPVRIHYLKLTEHLAPVPKRHCPFFWISPLLPDTEPLKVLYRSGIRSSACSDGDSRC